MGLQPRSYGEPPDRSTLFGWSAPSVEPWGLERDRFYVAVAAWLCLGLVLGPRWPARRRRYVGPAVMIPVVVLFYWTAPHDAEGWWVVNGFLLPFLAVVVSVVAEVAPRVHPLLLTPAASALLAGLGVSVALRMSTGETLAFTTSVAAIVALLFFAAHRLLAGVAPGGTQATVPRG